MRKKKKPQSSNNRPLNHSGSLNIFQGRRLNIAAFVLIGLVALIAYSNTFYAEMQFDDTLQIVAQSKVNDLANFSSFSDWSNINKRPLAFFSFALNYFFGDYHVFGYHIVNIMIHIMAAFVLFLLSRLIFTRIFSSQAQNKINLAALFTALIFAAHPIQTQAVTYIIQRMTSLSALFYLLAVFTYVQGRIQHQMRKHTPTLVYYGITLLAFLLSLLTKQIAVTLPFALLLFEFFFIRDKKGKPSWKYLIISLSVLIAGAIIIILLGYLPRETTEITRHDYLITQFRVIAKYFQLLILPVHQNLDYNFTLSETLWGWKELASLCLLVLLIGLGIFFRKKAPSFAFGIFWIFLTLAVESSIIPIRDVIFEHRLYLPMAGFAILISGLSVRFIKPKLMPVLMIIILITLTSATWSRNRVWKTQTSLWTDVAQKAPNYGRPWYNLGKVNFEQGKLNDCIRYSKKSLEIDPDNPKAWYNIGLCYEKQGNDDLAVKFYKKAVENDSTFGRSLNNLGSLYIRKGEFDDAIYYLLKAMKSDKKQSSILQNLGVAYFNIKKYNKAIKYNKKYIKINPSNADILADIGLSYMQLKKYEDAKEWFKKAIEINPKKTSAYIDCGTCYYQYRDYQTASKYYQKALDIEPENSIAGKYLQMAKKRSR